MAICHEVISQYIFLRYPIRMCAYSFFASRYLIRPSSNVNHEFDPISFTDSTVRSPGIAAAYTMQHVPTLKLSDGLGFGTRQIMYLYTLNIDLSFDMSTCDTVVNILCQCVFLSAILHRAYASFLDLFLYY